MLILSFSKLLLEELRANLAVAGNIQMYRISLSLFWVGKGKSIPDAAKDIGV